MGSENKEKTCNDCEYTNYYDGEFWCENINSPVHDTYNYCVTGCYACSGFKQRRGPNKMTESILG